MICGVWSTRRRVSWGVRWWLYVVMPARLSDAAARELFRGCGAEPLFDEYLGSGERHRFRCSCGAEDSILFSTVGRKSRRDGSWLLRCGSCRNRGRPKYDIVSARALFSRVGVELLDSEYVHCDKGLSYRCGCGGEGVVALSSLVEYLRRDSGYRHRCGACSRRAFSEGLRRASSRRLTEEVKGVFLAGGAEPLFDEYPGDNTVKLPYRCGCGVKSSVSWMSLRQHGDVKCAGCRERCRPRGESHPSWDAGVGAEERALRRERPYWGVFSEWCMRMNGYRCEITGRVGGALSAHHIEGWAGNPRLRYRLDNIAVVSRDLHREYHSEYGYVADGAGWRSFREGRGVVGDLDRYRAEVVWHDVSSGVVENKRGCSDLLVLFHRDIRLRSGVVLGMLRTRSGRCVERVYARSLRLRRVDYVDVRDWMEESHLSGSVGGGWCYVLEDGAGVPVVGAVFGVNRYGSDAEYEWLRLASRPGWVVVGGAERLLSAFRGDVGKGVRVKAYADLRVCDLDPRKVVYSKLGFEYKRTTAPNYWYTRDGWSLVGRNSARKGNLPLLLGEGYRGDLSEGANMELAGYSKLEDLGSHVYVLGCG